MNEEKPAKVNWIWPSLRSREDAVKVVRRGGWLAAFQASITAIMAVTSIFLQRPILGLDGLSVLDAVLLAVISWRLFRHSFWWAVAAVIYQLISHLTLVSEGFHGNVVIAIMLLLVYINAMRGALHLRANKEKSEPIEAVHSEISGTTNLSE